MNKTVLSLDELQSLLQRHGRAFEALAELLIAENKIHNLTRITEPQQIRVRHFLDSLAALKVLEPAAADKPLICADVGSGAGFPVLPLAIARPQWTFISIEAVGKKAAFQRKACAALGLTNVEVAAERAEVLARDKRFRERFDAALVRAVADLSIAAELALGLVRVGGRLLAWKGPGAEEEIGRARPALEQMGASSPQIFSYTLPTPPHPAQFLLLDAEKTRPTPPTLPRSFAQIKHNPLGS